MKKVLTMTAIIAINFILQTSLFNFFQLFGVIPNISLILIVIFSMMTNGILGGIFGLFTGMLYDIMLYDIFGLFSLIYFTIGALIGTFSEEMNRDNYILYCLITAVATVFMNFASYVLLFFLKYRIDNISKIMSNMIIEVILNTFITVAVLKFIVYLFDKIDIK
jgi:rod shape-determining protein MreD